jgi:hypothetical protein
MAELQLVDGQINKWDRDSERTLYDNLEKMQNKELEFMEIIEQMNNEYDEVYYKLLTKRNQLILNIKSQYKAMLDSIDLTNPEPEVTNLLTSFYQQEKELDKLYKNQYKLISEKQNLSNSMVFTYDDLNSLDDENKLINEKYINLCLNNINECKSEYISVGKKLELVNKQIETTQQKLEKIKSQINKKLLNNKNQ